MPPFLAQCPTVSLDNLIVIFYRQNNLFLMNYHLQMAQTADFQFQEFKTSRIIGNAQSMVSLSITKGGANRITRS